MKIHLSPSEREALRKAAFDGAVGRTSRTPGGAELLVYLLENSGDDLPEGWTVAKLLALLNFCFKAARAGQPAAITEKMETEAGELLSHE